MQLINFESYVKETERFLTYTNSEILEYQKQKIKELIKYVKLHSEFYSNLYKSINVDCFSIEELPIISKQTLIENFDSIVTDKAINQSVIDEYFNAPFDFDRLLFQSYLAFHTSGSTGQSVNVVWSMEDFSATTANYFVRLTKDSSDISRECILYIGITDDYIGGNSWAYQLGKYINIQIESVFTPIDELCRIINTIQPTIIMTKPSLLGELARKKGKGLLSIHPERVIFAGEIIMPQDKYDIERYFGIHVNNSYATCETGPIAYQYDITAEQMDVFRNMVYVELIDEKGCIINEPFQLGNIVITSLQNKTMPLLRYNTGDKAYYTNNYNGNQKLSYITGRSTSYFIFSDSDIAVKVSEYPFWNLYVTGIVRYQVIQQSQNSLLLKVQYIENLSTDEKKKANSKILQRIEKILNKNTLSFKIIVKIEESQIRPDAAGKIKITYPLKEVIKS